MIVFVQNDIGYDSILPRILVSSVEPFAVIYLRHTFQQKYGHSASP